MVLLTHHSGEHHGILGAQAAATYLTRNLSIPSIVVGLRRTFSEEHLLGFLDTYYEGRERIIAFSHLSGRKDLLRLIGTLKERGYFTILGGPQAEVDYYGEVGAETYPTRFKGLRNEVDLAVQGPIDSLRPEHLQGKRGSLSFSWRKEISINVDWSTIYTFSDELEKLDVQTGQVLNAIGCPYARKRSLVMLDEPESLKGSGLGTEMVSYGCIFCDVSRDKGFHGHVDRGVLLSQIRGLPEKDGRKITFELIDEYPLESLKGLLDDAQREGVDLTQINGVCRIDDINEHEDLLYDVLKIARDRNVRIMFSSIGFESFSDKILKYFNKGITVQDIVKGVGILRRLKDRFPDTLLYRTDEGAHHGFIHPTPWDDSETVPEMDRNIFLHRFYEDILPPHSTPLIIHHASCLGDWIRSIESKTEVRFGRDGTWIEWWAPQEAPAHR